LHQNLTILLHAELEANEAICVRYWCEGKTNMNLSVRKLSLPMELLVMVVEIRPFVRRYWLIFSGISSGRFYNPRTNQQILSFALITKSPQFPSTP